MAKLTIENRPKSRLLCSLQTPRIIQQTGLIPLLSVHPPLSPVKLHSSFVSSTSILKLTPSVALVMRFNATIVVVKRIPHENIKLI